MEETNKELSQIKELWLIGPNKLHTISFTAIPYSTYSLGAWLSTIGGWYVGNLQLPHAINLLVTDSNYWNLPQFVKDLKQGI